jgi:hypothetical protein
MRQDVNDVGVATLSPYQKALAGAAQMCISASQFLGMRRTVRLEA